MISQSPTLTVPLSIDESGGIRVSGTRVTLDVIIARYQHGETPESIRESFPSVPLVDIYAIIAYYLAHREDVDAYLARRAEESARMRQAAAERQTPEQQAAAERLRRLWAEKNPDVDRE